MKISGYLYDPGSSARSEAKLARRGNRFFLTSPALSSEREVEIGLVADRLAKIPQSVTFGNGQRFIPRYPLPEEFLHLETARAVRWIDWLERATLVKTVVLLAFLAASVVALRQAVPFAADGAAALIPAEMERAVGKQAFREFDAIVLEPSQLSIERRERMVSTANELARIGDIDPVPAIEFRHAPLIGPNAFAFPGGPILVTDELVEVLEGDATVVAVIAHEMGHVEKRHGLRQALRVGGILLIATLVFGDDGSMLEELSTIAGSLVNLQYSRDFERDADSFAADILIASGRSSEDLATALQTLAQECGKPCSKESGWLSTHPVMADRISALQDR